MTSNEGECIDWKPSPNICRCCLTDGCYKDISSTYYFSGEKENYEDLLKETLDIKIPYLSVGRLICEDCIARLRDAYAFKQTILRSDATLTQYYDKLHLSGGIDMESDPKLPDVKAEPLALEADSVSNGCQDDNLDDDEILANIKMELSNNEASLEEGTSEPARQRGKRRGRIKHENTDVNITDSDQEKWTKLTERRGTGPLLRENSLKLLANSTACVFQWNKSWYRCFCCKDTAFPDMVDLKQHTQTHTLEHIKKKIILQQNRLVKVEISDLCCKICKKSIENLDILKLHLKEHGIKIEEDLLVPFKIEENLKCQICFENFTVFRLLNMHMNKHFQKQVCHICGAAFSNLVFLNLHKTRSHRPFRCKHCGDVFLNKIDKKHHEITIHNIKFERKLRFPCPYCNERFFQENFKVLHLVEKHGLPKPEHKCLICEKSFVTKSLCNNHMKNVHMKEKNHECDVCHNLFYTKSDVARHRVTHSGEKRFSCTLCSNPFATKDSLRRHMKRAHVVLNC